MRRFDDFRPVFSYRVAFPFLVALFLPLASAQADEFHYFNQLIGNRASGMGGAYTAISDDPAGLYYNPAGAVYAQASNLTASVNAFTVIEKTYSEVLGGRYDWRRESASLMPNYFGITQPFWKGILGLSFAVPDSIIEDQDQNFTTNFPSSLQGLDITQYTINIKKQDETYKFGPSFGMSITDNFSVGLTGYFHYRSKDYIKNEYVMLDYSSSPNTYNDYEWTNYYYESNEYGFEPILGLMWSPVDKLSLGLRISKVAIFTSETVPQTTYRSEILGNITNFSYDDTVEKASHKKREHPVNVRVGVGYFLSESLMFTGDFSYYTATDDNYFGDREATWDVAVGSEWYFSPKLALRAGLFTQNANTPDVVTGKVNQAEHIDLYGGSLSLTRFTKNSTLTGGASLSMGSGEAQIFANAPMVQKVDQLSYTIYLATSYNY
ncbi:MAG: hypothetical protein KJ950_09225 [Proteobacteria bacterium]|nr:hypothetical protein [Pseudomonadota bacterium]MBU1687664.1 hypothetical protein [Pseudomonadota bacterium]